MYRSVKSFAGLVIALMLGAVLLAPAAASAATKLSWSSAQIDQQASVDANDIYALSCPSATLCIAGDNAGNILTSTNPGGGRKAWTVTKVEASSGLPWINGVSCPSGALCVAVDQSGAVLESTDPTGGAKAWQRVKLSATTLSAIACPSTTQCVAVGGAEALNTTAPTGGSAQWHAQTIDAAKNILSSVSCPTTGFCAAVDDEGNVLTSPGTAGPWTSTHLSSRALMGISCASAALCVATDDDGSAWSSTTPTGGASAWHRSTVTLAGGTRGVACVGVSLCVTGNLGIRYTLDADAPSPTWVQSTAGGTSEANAISCASADFCAEVDGGDVSVSSSPATGSWTAAAQIDGAPTLFGVSCPTTSRCYAGDDSGHIFVSKRPSGGASTWKVTGPVSNTTGAGFYGLACPTLSFCVAGRDESPIGTSGSGGTGTYTTNPTGSVNGWKTIPLLHGPDPVVHGFFNAGCAGKNLCAITWDSGALSISTTPSKAASWKKISSKGLHPGVYCPKSGRCVAPGGSCPTRSFCAVLSTVGDGTGSATLSVSTDPARGSRGGWKTLTIDRGKRLTAVACTSASECFAVDASGRILNSTRPTVASSWHVVKTVAEPLEAIACPSNRLCVAVGQNGIAVTGAARG